MRQSTTLFWMLSLGVISSVACSGGKNAPVGGVSPTYEARESSVGSEFEKPPVFAAKEILTRSELKGAGFTVDKVVRNDGWMNHFEIESDYGRFYAGSLDMARVRLAEIEALNALYQRSQGGVFVDSTVDVGKNILLAPFRAVASFVKAIANPSETWKKVEGVPEGASRLWGTISRSVSESLKSDDGGKGGGTKQLSLDSAPTEQDVARAAEFGLRQFGFNLSKTEREWYKKNEIDPYTDNPILRDRVSRLASIQAATKLTSRFLPGIGGLGLIDDANRYLKWADRISLYEDPSEIAQRNITKLREMGVSEQAMKDFYSNRYLTPTYQSVITEALRILDTVGDRSEFISLCATATRREDAIFFTKIAAYYAYLHKNEGELREIVVDRRVPAAVRRTGRLILALPVDYLIWSPELATTMRAFEREVTSKQHIASVEMRVQGRVSQRVKSELARRKIEVVERVKLRTIDD